jgi:dihydrodipicolinate synthase/N-acetylneuraminate lyase
VLQRGRSLGQSLAAMKAALHLQGIGIPAMLPPLQALDAAAISALAGELAALETSDWVASA